MVNLKKDIALSIENVSIEIPLNKIYQSSLKDKLFNNFRNLLKRSKDKNLFPDSIQPIKNISLNIYKGDRYALIGPNGAGKTTFLKLISGIYKPSSGFIKKEVEIFPLISKSFLVDHELTGFEAAKAHYYIFRNINVDFEYFIKDIISFSGLKDSIYLPINSYSDGMKTRLIFSLYTAFFYECLAMDEGLGTGDIDFIKKANARLSKFIEKSGTLFLASHSEELLKRFCDKGIVFTNGRIIFNGDLNDALDFYRKEYV